MYTVHVHVYVHTHRVSCGPTMTVFHVPVHVHLFSFFLDCSLYSLADPCRGGCLPTYSYRHVVTLTEDDESFSVCFLVIMLILIRIITVTTEE